MTGWTHICDYAFKAMGSGTQREMLRRMLGLFAVLLLMSAVLVLLLLLDSRDGSYGVQLQPPPISWMSCQYSRVT